MIKSNTIIINAPLADIFAVASDLPRWPEYLAHYHYNKYLSPMPWGGVVKMSAVRSGITTTWVSVYRIDAENQQLHFEHIKSFMNASRGMIVTWTFEELPEGGVKVEIIHDHELKWPLIGPLVNKWIVNGFFIHHIASLTLAGLKRRMENQSA
jgi:hypothetical protein